MAIGRGMCAGGWVDRVEVYSSRKVVLYLEKY